VPPPSRNQENQKPTPNRSRLPEGRMFSRFRAKRYLAVFLALFTARTALLRALIAICRAFSLP